MWHIRKMEYDLAIKQNEVLVSAATWIYWVERCPAPPAPPKRCIRVLTPGSCECDLLWEKGFCRLPEDLEMRSSYIIWLSLNSMMCPYKRHRGKTGKRGENHVKTGRGWTDASQAKKCLEPLKLEEARKDPILDALEEVWPCRHHDFGPLASRTVRINFCSF